MSATLDPQDLFAQFVRQSENTIALEFTRDEQPGLGFSAETLEGLNSALLTFVAARAQRWFDQNADGAGMTKLAVTLRVEFS